MKIEIDEREGKDHPGNRGYGIVGMRISPETIEESNILQLFEKAGDFVFQKVPDGGHKYHWLVTPKGGHSNSCLWTDPDEEGARKP